MSVQYLYKNNIGPPIFEICFQLRPCSWYTCLVRVPVFSDHHDCLLYRTKNKNYGWRILKKKMVYGQNKNCIL